MRPRRVVYLSGLWLHDLWFLKHLHAAGHEVLSVRVYRTPGHRDLRPDLEPLTRIRHLEAVDWFAEAEAAGEIPDLGMARRLRRLLEAERPDVLQCGWLSDGGVLAALTGFRPLLMTPFGSDVLINPRRSPEHYWKARLALQAADAITTDALEVAHRISQLSGFPEASIVRFPWGIDLGRFRPDAAPVDLRARFGWTEGPVLISTRNLEPVYGIAHLLRAFAAVRERIPAAKLLLAGDGSLRSSHEAAAGALGLTDAVRFLGHVPNADLPGWLRAADLYVTASLSDGTSRSLMEAFACGLPAVVTDPPAYREWVREGVHGTLVARGNAGALAAGILEILAHPGLKTELRRNALETAAAHFDERKNFAKLEGMYEALAAAPGAPPPGLGPPMPLPPLDLASVGTMPFTYPSLKARAAEWLVIAALWSRVRSRRMPGWPAALTWP